MYIHAINQKHFHKKKPLKVGGFKKKFYGDKLVCNDSVTRPFFNAFATRKFTV